MIAKLLEKILMAAIRKERAISLVISFLIGAASTALGTNVELVYQELCSGKGTPEQQQSQEVQ